MVGNQSNILRIHYEPFKDILFTKASTREPMDDWLGKAHNLIGVFSCTFHSSLHIKGTTILVFPTWQVGLEGHMAPMTLGIIKTTYFAFNRVFNLRG